MKKAVLALAMSLMASVSAKASNDASDVGGVASPIFYSVNYYRAVLEHGQFDAFNRIQKMTANGGAIRVFLDDGCIQTYIAGIRSMDPLGGNEVFYARLAATENCD